MSYYLDTSILVSALVRQSTSAATDAFFDTKPQNLLISPFAQAEFYAAISRLVRMQELSAQDATEVLSDFDAWSRQNCRLVTIENSDYRTTCAIVRRFDLMLRAPDALHAALCDRLTATLVTLDQRLATAATSLGIPVLVPPPA